MQETVEQPTSQDYFISIRFSFTDGNAFVRYVPVSKSDMVEQVLKWFRDKKGEPTISWKNDDRQIMVIRRTHVMTIEIDGYIELTRISYKWYEKIWDKVRTYLVFRALKGGDINENSNKKTERRCIGQGHD